MGDKVIGFLIGGVGCLFLSLNRIYVGEYCNILLRVKRFFFVGLLLFRFYCDIDIWEIFRVLVRDFWVCLRFFRRYLMRSSIVKFFVFIVS